MDITQLLPIFVTGLFAGGLSCMAVQGGLLASTIAQRHEERLQNKAMQGTVWPILAFLIAKLITYTALGFLLGLLGSAFQVSLQLQIILQFAVVLFMIATALHLLRVHPLFRYIMIQPPHFASRLLRREMKSKSIFAPALLGALTVFIPCGATQAVMALAVASANPLTGALMLFAFVLGTSPIFFLLGYFTIKLGERMQFTFRRFAAVVLLVFALFNLNNTIALTGSNYTIEDGAQFGWCLISFCEDGVENHVLSNDAVITIDNQGYSPRMITVQAGKLVNIHLNNVSGSGCTQAFTIPQLSVQEIVPVGKSRTVSFVAPRTPGKLSFMCSMGMYRGTINVI